MCFGGHGPATELGGGREPGALQLLQDSARPSLWEVQKETRLGKLSSPDSLVLTGNRTPVGEATCHPGPSADSDLTQKHLVLRGSSLLQSPPPHAPQPGAPFSALGSPAVGSQDHLPGNNPGMFPLALCQGDPRICLPLSVPQRALDLSFLRIQKSGASNL